MAYFYGDVEHAIDDRGRISVPAPFRRDLEEGAIVRVSKDGCVELYARADFNAEADRRTGDAGTGRRQSRRVRRLLGRGTVSVDLDRQGRLLLPPAIRTDAGLNDRAFILGCVDYIEIWDPERWSAEQSTLDAEDDELEAEL